MRSTGKSYRVPGNTGSPLKEIELFHGSAGACVRRDSCCSLVNGFSINPNPGNGCVHGHSPHMESLAS